jgi:hypothetical protein
MSQAMPEMLTEAQSQLHIVMFIWRRESVFRFWQLIGVEADRQRLFIRHSCFLTATFDRIIGTIFITPTQLVIEDVPNKSPEHLTAVGACSSAVAVHIASRRWLSFFR